MRITDKMLYQHAEQARELWLRTLPQRDEVPEPSVSAAFEQSMDARFVGSAARNGAKRLSKPPGGSPPSC